MPKVGYRPGKRHRRNLSEAKQKFWQEVNDLRSKAAADASARKAKKERFANPGKQATYTPVPPSAGYVETPAFERWGIYSLNAEGKYYYKREQATTLEAVKKVIKELELPYPLWAFVKSGKTQDECTLPIRIAEDAIPALGHRFQPLRKKK